MTQRTEKERVEIPALYPLRWGSFFGSFGLHWLLIGVMVFLVTQHRILETTLYYEPAQPPERKTLYFDVRYQLPEVTSAKKLSTADPRGAEVSKHTVVATSPSANSNQQIILQPMPLPELPKDVVTPDFTARLNVELPPPPKPAPKRSFIPPPVERPQQPAAISTIDIPNAPPSTTLSSSSSVLINTQLPSAPSPPSVPSPSKEPPVGSVGNASADVTVANLRSNEAKAENPAGSRSGQFSKAPVQGVASGGSANSGAVQMANLDVRSEKAKTGPAQQDLNRRTPILYAQRVRSVSLSTLSVPLRPSSRTIPRMVNARFVGRNVYTIVVPIENLPSYVGDWIVWFAEREPLVGETPAMRAPMPFRKLELVEPVDSTSPVQRVQVAAVIEKNGKLNPISVMTVLTPMVQKAILQDLTSWEFQPATRNGTPIDIEIVIEVSLRLPVAVAQSASSN